MGDRLARTDKGRKLGDYAPSFLWGGELGLHLTQCGLGRGLPLYKVQHLDSSRRLARIYMGRKLGCVPLFRGGGRAGTPPNIAWDEAFLHMK